MSEVCESLMRLELANPVRSVRSDPHMELLLDQVGDPDRNEWVFDCLSVAQSDTPSVLENNKYERAKTIILQTLISFLIFEVRLDTLELNIYLCIVILIENFFIIYNFMCGNNKFWLGVPLVVGNVISETENYSH